MTTLGYALLGLLARRPLSGYDLAGQLKVPVGFFWHARISQIYPELARLEAQGLLSHRVVAQWDRPDKKVYAITEAGRRALREWATAPTAVPLPRDELVLKAYSLWLADPARALELFREHERRHAERLALYETNRAALQGDFERGEPDAACFGDYATLQRGVGYEREYVAWCRWMVEQLERRVRDRPAGAGRPGVAGAPRAGDAASE